MEKTVNEHLEDSNQVTSLISNANALVKKLQAELSVARNTLDALREMQHPKIRMPVPYQLKDNSKDDHTTPAGVIHQQIERINTLLGDRA